MDRRQVLGLTIGGIAAGFLTFPTLAARRKPNFIVIYCDDLGYGDVGFMGGAIPTPHIDAMAKQGTVLTDYYAPAALCTPSRAGMLTGRYPIRMGLAYGVIMQNDKNGLPLNEVTIAKALKPEYVSALVGKWHLGHVEPYWPPTKHGFDLFYGTPYSHDMMPLNLYEAVGDSVTELPFEYPQLQEMFYARAEKFIEDNKNRPFFLDLALSAPHLPNYPIAEFAGTSKEGAYGDVVREIDDIVGRLLAKLKTLGLDRDTMVIFTSDNGPWFEGSPGPLRNRKGGGGYDGGYRVPFIAWMPGMVAAGRHSNAIAMGIDFLPTFCAMAGKAPPAGVHLDGMDISAVLERGAASPHKELLLFNNEDVVGIRTQHWAYVGADYFVGHYIPYDGRGYPQLYDERDKSENYSVASLHPDVAARLEKDLHHYQTEFASLHTRSSSFLDDAAKSRNSNTHVPKIWKDFGNE